jgi:predicted ATPase
LIQQPEVHLHPRAQAELGTLFARSVGAPAHQTFVIETHGDYIIDRIRIEVARGCLKKEDVTIVFFERDQHGSTATNLYVNENGEIENAPDGFRSFFLEEQTKLLGLQRCASW